MFDLTGKVALITGGARGQGATEARLFASLGAAVTIADVLDDEGGALAAEIGERGRFEHLDVTRRPDWERVVAETVATFGGLDVLVNNAGVALSRWLVAFDEDEYRRVIEINQLGVALGMHCVIEAMRARGGGSIINISSTGGNRGVAGSIAYSSSKWAVRGMTKTAAVELGRYGIRVNSVHPGVIDTAMVAFDQYPEAAQRAIVGDLPLPRIGTADDVAATVAFLASDASSYCTGGEYLVDGGSLAGRSLFADVVEEEGVSGPSDPVDHPGPLAGIRVLDLGHLWAAPMATMLLADQGASVIRVLRPGSDEATRSWFDPLHRNKRIVEIDLSTTAGRSDARALAEGSDVVVESFRPGVMARHGLDADTLLRAHPHLVHLALPGFASVDRSRRDLPGWEAVIAAAMGLYTTGLRQSLHAPPVFHAVPIPSAFAAAHGAIAVLAALYRRSVDGGGAALEVPLAHAALAACSRSFCFAGAGVRTTATPPRAVPAGLEALVLNPDDDAATRAAKLGQLATIAPPNYSIHHYRCADGKLLLVMPIKPDMVDRYLRVLGIEAAVRAEGYVNDSPWQGVERIGAANLASSWTMSADRNRWLIDRIQAVVGTRTADEWIQVFTEARIPCSAQHTRDEWMARPDVIGSGLVVSLEGRPDTTVVGRLADVDVPDAPGTPDNPLLRFSPPTTATVAEVVDPVRAAPPAGVAPTTTKANLLAGIRVLDLCNVVAGPNAGYVFAQLGADVIRLEPPTSFNLPMHHAWTLEVNQGKRSAVLDITTHPGRRAFEALVRSADIVIHNRLDDVAARLGLTPADLQEVNPNVVVCQISAFGGSIRNGIERQPGYDPHPNLATGLDALLGSPDEPRQAEEILSDLLGGLSGAFAAACALHVRQTTGTAPAARGSLARGTSFLQAPWMVAPAAPGGWTDATGPDAVGLSPTYRLFQAEDSWVALAAPTLDADTLADLVGSPDVEGIEAALSRRPAAEWSADLEAHGVAVHEVRSIDDLCANAAAHAVANTTEDLSADGPIAVVSWPDHPSGVPVVLPEPAWVLVGPDHSYRRLSPTPVVGTHTREVLADAGLDDTEIDELFRLRIAHDHLPAIVDPAQYFFVPERAEAS